MSDDGLEKLAADAQRTSLELLEERDDLKRQLEKAERARDTYQTRLLQERAHADTLAGALEVIASYDKRSKFGDGICEYGCDALNIAREALTDYRNRNREQGNE